MSFTQNVNQEDEKILQTIKDNPALRACFLEMIEIADDSSSQLNRGDDAEEAVIQTIQKTGAVILQEWAQKKADKAAQELKNEPDIRMHEKKRCCGTHL